jgi:hypothetical protein
VRLPGSTPGEAREVALRQGTRKPGLQPRRRERRRRRARIRAGTPRLR